MGRALPQFREQPVDQGEHPRGVGLHLLAARQVTAVDHPVAEVCPQRPGRQKVRRTSLAQQVRQRHHAELPLRLARHVAPGGVQRGERLPEVPLCPGGPFQRVRPDVKLERLILGFRELG